MLLFFNLLIISFCVFFWCEWRAWKTNIKFSFPYGTKLYWAHPLMGSLLLCSISTAVNKQSLCQARWWGATAHLYNLSSSFTSPILTYNQRLETPIEYSQSPSFHPTCAIAYCEWEVGRGQQGLPAGTCGIFLFTFFLSCLISTRLGRLAGETLHRDTGNLTLCLVPHLILAMQTHLIAAPHWTNFTEK